MLNSFWPVVSSPNWSDTSNRSYRSYLCASKNYHHRAFRNIIVKLADVPKMHDHASPRKMTWTIVLPFLVPTMKADATTEFRVLQSGFAFEPRRADLISLRFGDDRLSQPAFRI